MEPSLSKDDIKKMTMEERKKYIAERMKKLDDKLAAINKAADEEKKRIQIATEKRKGRKLNKYESEYEVAKNYPNLGGRYFPCYNGININYMVSCDMNDVERTELFSYWDQGVHSRHRKITVSKSPDYVRINRFHFVENDIGEMIVTRLSDEEYD
jgi:hypothetical protein